MTKDTEEPRKGLFPKPNPNKSDSEVVPASRVLLEKFDREKHYKVAQWAPELSTFQCFTCGHCDVSEDGMKLHVLIHVPEAEREDLLNNLIKEQ